MIFKLSSNRIEIKKNLKYLLSDIGHAFQNKDTDLMTLASILIYCHINFDITKQYNTTISYKTQKITIT